MKKLHLKLLMFVFALGTCLTTALFLSRPAQSEVKQLNDETASSEVIAGYKKWTRVNPEPKMVSSRIAIQCAMVSAAQQNMEENNPHRSKLVVVYVNDTGRAAMMEQKLPHFPQGSIIVKEKLATKESAAPELLTVMRKRESGYDPKMGDWEYMVFDGAASVVQASGKLEKCRACHLLEKDTDYVSRNYLPNEVWQKLK